MMDMPIWMTNLASVFCGLAVGSFVNVLVYRLPRDESVIRPGSHCTACNRAIRWWDNLPVISYIWLLGKCRSCHQAISFRYPLIELLTALLFLAVRVHFGWTPVLFLRDWPFIGLLMAITFIDLEHRIIPDVLSLGGLVLGLATCFLVDDPGWGYSFLGALIGFSVFYSLAWTYQKITGRSGLGGGDIKLLAMIGAFVGPAGVLTTIFISSIFGSCVGIGWALVQGKADIMKHSLPYGPFLVIGALYFYLLGDILWFQFMTPM